MDDHREVRQRNREWALRIYRSDNPVNQAIAVRILRALSDTPDAAEYTSADLVVEQEAKHQFILSQL